MSLVETAADLVKAKLSHTPMTTDEMLSEITKVHAALKNMETGEAIAVPEREQVQKPVVTMKDSFKKHEIICMICGKGGFKTLSRHLSQAHGMRPNAYKKQFGIPSKQPLTAKSYSESRKKMASENNLSDHLVKARAVRLANVGKKKKK